VPGVDFHGGAYLVTPTASRYWATVAESDPMMTELMKLMMPDCCWQAIEMVPVHRHTVAVLC